MPADDEILADRYRFTMDYLRDHGYEHYEISSFALPGARSVHNSRYWSHHNYLGFGPSAHSFWRFLSVTGKAALCFATSSPRTRHITPFQISPSAWTWGPDVS